MPEGGSPPARRPRREPSARRVGSKPGQAPPPPTGTAAWPSGPSGSFHSRLLSLTGAAGDSRETVITFAGARSVFGETDGTIARQKHPFSALSWRAKASRVSRKRAEDPALVSMVSSRRRRAVLARKSSPCVRKMAQKRCYRACWASFFAETYVDGPCWAVFFAETPVDGPCWAVFFAETPETTASFGSPRVTGADLHGHTQRIRKRPGPWPRALPAKNELR